MHRNIRGLLRFKNVSGEDRECILPDARERSVCQRAVGGEGLGSGGGRRRVRNGERVRCVCSTRAIVREDYLPIVCRSLALSLSTAAQPPLSFSILHRAQALFRGFCATREERRLRSRETPHIHRFSSVT